MQNPFNKTSEVTMMLVKEGHCAEGLQNNTTSTKSSLATSLADQKPVIEGLARFNCGCHPYSFDPKVS